MVYCTRKNQVFGLCPLSNFFSETQRFLNWISFHLQVKRRWPLLCWVPYKELASVTGLGSLRLALSKGPNRVGATFFLPEDGNRSIFQYVVFLRKHWTMDKVQKHDSFKCLYKYHILCKM
jgi:hypothetical protein